MRIVIIGARSDGHGKVVLEILQAMGNMEIIGFIDDDLQKSNLSIRGIPVIGTSESIPSLKKEHTATGAIVAIADNRRRRQLGEKIIQSELRLVNAIHPTVHLDSDVSLGRGVVLCQGVIIVAGSKIGNCVNIHTGATIDHDNIIEDGANIGPGVHTAGRVRICRDAFIGTGALFLPDIEVGQSAIVGAGAVVIQSVNASDKVVGIPARSIKGS
jgi:sugar O-acyltransferase (sialic acid O-acetyltransferase NeuD family)